MKRQIETPKMYSRREAARRAKQFLPAIQRELMPEHADQLVATNQLRSSGQICRWIELA